MTNGLAASIVAESDALWPVHTNMARGSAILLGNGWQRARASQDRPWSCRAEGMQAACARHIGEATP